MTTADIRLGILQRVLTDYRVPFFDLLAKRFPAGVYVTAGLPRPLEQIVVGIPQRADFHQLQNIHLLQGKLYLCRQNRVINWLEKWNPDVLIVEANPRYLSTTEAVHWMHRHNRPVIGWGLGSPVGNGMLAMWRRRFINQFDALLTYSRSGKDQYAAIGFDPEKIFVAPNAASSRPVGDPPKRENGFRKGRGEVIFVGRLQARKRVDLLLKACASLPVILQPRLTIVGDGPERNTLCTLAAQIYPQTVFSGDQRGVALQALFLRADVFVLPGTGGLALQQALSFALPAIAAEGDGTQADLVSPENGWLVEPGNLESLQAALKEALQDPITLRKKGLASFRIVHDKINLESMAEGFISAIEYVAKDSRK